MKKFFFSALLAVGLSGCVDYTENVPPPTVMDFPGTTLERIGFGSCHHQLFKPFKAMEALATENLDLMIMAGDNLYADMFAIAPGSENFMNDSYSKLFDNPTFKSFYNSVPFVTTWDDHDFGQNDGDKTNTAKEYAKKLFFKYWNLPTPRRENPDGAIYGSYYYGASDKRVQVIALDQRWNLSPREGDQIGGYQISNDPSKTILGEVQWNWLEQELLKPAKVRIIISSYQFAATYNKFEAWNLFPLERQKMLDLIKSTQAEGVVFISGDVHYADLSVVNEPGLYPIYDLTSSGMNFENSTPYENENRITSFQGLNYGMINIDWSTTPAQISLEVRNPQSEKKIEKVVTLDELKF